jgi:hypothetical protein
MKIQALLPILFGTISPIETCNNSIRIKKITKRRDYRIITA